MSELGTIPVSRFVGSRPVVILALCRLRYETALAEANSFLSECQPFGNIARAICSARGSSGADVASVLVDTQFGGGGGGSEQV